MKRKTNEVILIATTIILVSLNGITSYAKGPGETSSVESKKVNIITYYQDTVRSLGNWEQQSGGYWKFKQTVDGSYLTNSWIESLSEERAFYYVNENGLMVTSCTTPDGYVVDARGLWRATSVSNPNVSAAPSTGSDTKVAPKDYGRYAWLFYDEDYKQDLRDHPIDTDHSLN
ncbi:hypothetical protein [Lacrimispora sphenoides]|uniref:Cell wall binding repeat-containing protein n=1 Tax=Lacrimispora sphenoides JCM 1415 TaxID=1297793 RepID=A0ABY1CH46_9FIRM|nr:hypothetical protein [Lacrimispora sphenoides]SEU04098.1 hypothetical protein SAMN02745906_4267 [[Clostridium] sphenoides JCM 1415]SUY48844.1 D-alanyl-D-alanine carboxypeptidase [Lacrimispora sphenoides]